MRTIEVTGSSSYPILTGIALEEIGAYLDSHLKGISNIVIVTQQLVADFHLKRLLSGLQDYKVKVLTVPQGEEAKSLTCLSKLTTEGVEAGMDRHSLVIALGGGVVGDLAGFFAAIYMRGVRFLQIPTTLLAQVDSSIGGKVAVNHEEGKNLLGAFYPPQAVGMDFSTLETLPWSEVQNGLAETVKHAILGDAELFEFLEKERGAIAKRDLEIWRELTVRSLMVKVKIVGEDEKEHGKRAFLNLGHTFGHALETEGNFTELTHGQGVSVGIAAAAYLAESRGYIETKERERMISLLQAFRLPISVAGKDRHKLLSLMGADKKNQAGRKVLILPVGIGQVTSCKDCSDEEILWAWDRVID